MGIDPSIQPLINVTSTLDFEECEGWLELRGVIWSGDDAHLDIVVHQQDVADQRWAVWCSEVRNSCVRNNFTMCPLKVLTQHPLLLPHTSPVVDLHFRGRPCDADATVGRIVSAHRAVVGDWFAWTEFLNVRMPGLRTAHDLLDGGFGVFAQGPQPLTEAYAEVLSSDGLDVSNPPPRAPMWWNGERWIREPAQLFALIIGESYFVTPAITAEKT